MLLSAANADRGRKVNSREKLYLKSNFGEFSSEIVIKLSALKIDVTKQNTRLKHP